MWTSFVTQRLVPTAALLLALLAAPPAWADRMCELPASVTGRICPVEVCIALQIEVNTVGMGRLGCNKISGCSALKAMRQKWLDYYVARSRINVVCWGGGDEGHQIAAAQAIEQVTVCDGRIALPEPVGCANPCP